MECPASEGHLDFSLLLVPRGKELLALASVMGKVYADIPALMILAMAMGAFAQQGAFPQPSWSRTKAADQKSGSLVERGAAVFNNWCSACRSFRPIP